MDVFSYEFFKRYLTLEYFFETERFARAIAGFGKLEPPHIKTQLKANLAL